MNQKIDEEGGLHPRKEPSMQGISSLSYIPKDIGESYNFDTSPGGNKIDGKTIDFNLPLSQSFSLNNSIRHGEIGVNFDIAQELDGGAADEIPSFKPFIPGLNMRAVEESKIRDDFDIADDVYRDISPPANQENANHSQNRENNHNIPAINIRNSDQQEHSFQPNPADVNLEIADAQVHSPADMNNNNFMSVEINNNADLLDEDEEDNPNSSAKRIKRFLHRYFKYHLVLLFTTLLFVLTFKQTIAITYPFIFLWMVDIYDLVVQCNTEQTVIVKLVEMLEIILGALTKLCVLLYLYDKSFAITFTLLPLILFSITKTLVQMCRKGELCKTINLGGLFVRVFVCLQVINIALKLDELIKWQWKEVFWTYWVIFSVMIGVTFAVSLMILSKFCYFICGDVDSVERSFWLFTFLAGTTVISCVLVIALLDFLDVHQIKGQGLLDGIKKGDWRSFTSKLIPTMAYNFFSAVFTMLFRKDIEQFFLKTSRQNNNNNNDSNANSEQPAPQETRPIIMSEVEKAKPKEEDIDIPKFLFRTSATYFKRASENEYRTQRDELKKQSRLKRITTQRSRLRTNSIDYGVSPLRITSRADTSEYQTQRDALLGALTCRSKEDNTDTLRSPRLIQLSTMEPLTSTRTRAAHSPLLASYTRSPNTSAMSPYKICLSRTPLGVSPVPTDRDKSRGELFSAVREDYTFDNARHEQDTEGVKDNINILDDYKSQYNLTARGVESDSPPTLSPLNLNRREQSPMALRTKVTPIAIPKKDLNLPPDDELDATGNVITNRMNLFHSFQVERQALDTLLQSIECEIQQELKTNQIIKVSEPKERTDSTAAHVEKPANLCLVCFDNPPDAVFMECGHGGVCYECSLEVWKATGECFLCRMKITQVLQIDIKNIKRTPVIKVISSTQMVTYEDEAEDNNESQPNLASQLEPANGPPGESANQ